MAVAKVILNGTTLMDTTDKTVDAASMLSGVTALKNDGTTVTGSAASKSSSDLTVSGATVTAPAGFYSSAATKSVASGTAGTPTATKGSVNNHSISVTPSVTNTTGYITGSTINGTAVSVSASELVSGTKLIDENGTGIDVANYALVDVAVSGGGGVTIEGIKINGGTFTVSTTYSGTQTIPHGLGKKPMAGCIWPITNTTNNSGTYAGVGGWFSFATGDKSNIFPSTIEVQNPDSSIQNFAEVGLYVANGGNTLEPSKENVWSFGTTYFQEPDATNLYFSIPSGSGVILGGVEYGWWAAVADDDGNVSAGGGSSGYSLADFAVPNAITGAFTVDVSESSSLRTRTFAGMTGLTSVLVKLGSKLPASYMFSDCTGLQTLVFISTNTNINSSYIALNCTALSVVDYAMPGKIAYQDFAGDTNFTTLILRNSSGVVGLNSAAAFNNTPFANGGTGGTIYIPKVLYDALGTGTNDYKAASNWSTLDGYGTITWAKIEGSIYETHYADGTPIS